MFDACLWYSFMAQPNRGILSVLLRTLCISIPVQESSLADQVPCGVTSIRSTPESIMRAGLECEHHSRSRDGHSSIWFTILRCLLGSKSFRAWEGRFAVPGDWLEMFFLFGINGLFFVRIGRALCPHEIEVQIQHHYVWYYVDRSDELSIADWSTTCVTPIWALFTALAQVLRLSPQ